MNIDNEATQKLRVEEIDLYYRLSSQIEKFLEHDNQCRSFTNSSALQSSSCSETCSESSSSSTNSSSNVSARIENQPRNAYATVGNLDSSGLKVLGTAHECMENLQTKAQLIEQQICRLQKHVQNIEQKVLLTSSDIDFDSNLSKIPTLTLDNNFSILQRNAAFETMLTFPPNQSYHSVDNLLPLLDNKGKEKFSSFCSTDVVYSCPRMTKDNILSSSSPPHVVVKSVMTDEDGDNLHFKIIQFRSPLSAEYDRFQVIVLKPFGDL